MPCILQDMERHISHDFGASVEVSQFVTIVVTEVPEELCC